MAERRVVESGRCADSTVVADVHADIDATSNAAARSRPVTDYLARLMTIGTTCSLSRSMSAGAIAPPPAGSIP